MSLLDIDQNRTVIPKWRASDVTLLSGELSSLAVPPSRSELESDFLAPKVSDWLASPHSLAIATDLVGSALFLGRENEVPGGAKALLAAHCRGSATRSALFTSLTVSEPTTSGDCDDPRTFRNIWDRVHKLRSYLRDYPRDPLSWVDLARYYEILALREKSRIAMQAALALAPENRFVIRSAARLFIHQDAFDRAHALLVRCSATPRDPWLMAAEIATAASADISPRFYKKGKDFLRSGRLSPFHVAELYSAIATDDLWSGNLRHARRGFEKSLEQPSENAVAQARWATTHLAQLVVDDATLERAPLSAEGDALIASQSGQWKAALGHAWQWLFDQPFSSRPAALGSYVASMEYHYDEAIAIARAGLIANPKNFLLLNNLTYALATNNQLETAQKEFRRIGSESVTAEQAPIWNATKGLLEFRAGRPESGRACYRLAIEKAKGAAHNVANACANWAIEEVRIGSGEARASIERALEACKPLTTPDVRQWIKRLQKALAVPKVADGPKSNE